MYPFLFWHLGWENSRSRIDNNLQYSFSLAGIFIWTTVSIGGNVIPPVFKLSTIYVGPIIIIPTWMIYS
jgi:hypothetical protein